jgi:hypothetical protein
VQNDQQAATETNTVTVRDIPTRKTLADGSHLLAETTAFLVSSSSSSRSSRSKTARRMFCRECRLLQRIYAAALCPM